MPSSYYTHASGKPANQTRGLASEVRYELDSIAASFALLPSPTALASGSINYALDTGLTNAYVVSVSSAVTAYSDGFSFFFKPLNNNSGASTLNVNTLGLKAIVRPDGTAVQLNDIVANQILKLTYNSSYNGFQLDTDISYANQAAASASAAAASAGSAEASAAATAGAIVTERSAAATLTNKTLTSPVISTISNTGTLTLPTATDTLVGRATTDTLTNKTLAAPVITGGASISGNVSVVGQVSTTDNVGVGVTPGAWSTNRRSLQIGGNTVAAIGLGSQYSEITSNLISAAGGPTYTTSNQAGVFDFNNSVAGGYGWRIAPTGTAGNVATLTQAMTLDASGNLLPGANGTQAFGSTSLRWSQVWCTAGAFNTSDATLKTRVSKFNDAEIQVAIALTKEIGWFQWLDAVKDKGEEKARHHVGLTVQRAAELLESFGLDPWIYGFMSHDVWDDQITEHPAIEAKEAVLDGAGNVIEDAVEAKEAWSEITLKAGESYAFRYDQLNLFIARGIEARIEALEARA